MKVSLMLGNNHLIDPSYIEGFSFISDINSFYTKSKIFLKNFDLDFFNKIKIGSIVNVIFYEDNGSNSFYINPMAIVSSQKIARGETQLDDQIELVLTHSSFFKNSISSRAHGYSGSNNSGSSISNIIHSLILKEYPDEFSSLNIEPTDDVPSIRYQLNEKSQDFMMRIMKYANKEQLPAYLFLDAKNTLNLKCISNIVTKTPTQCLIAEETSQNMLNNESIKNMSKILMKSYNLSINASSSNSIINNKFTVNNFKFNDPSKRPINCLKSSGNTANNQFNVLMPEKTTISGWNLTPSDAMSIASRASFEKNTSIYNLTVNLTGIKLLESIPGTLLHVMFPYKESTDYITGKKAGVGDGNYMIERSMIGYQEKMWYTKLRLTYIS